MDEPLTSKTETYAGPSKTAIAVLESKVYGFIGGLVGVLGGFLSTSFLNNEGPMMRKAAAQLSHVPFIDRLTPKIVSILGAGLVGSFIGHFIGGHVGLLIGAKKSGDPEAQFNRTQARIVALEEEVASLKTGPKAEFTKQVPSRADHGSHGDAHRVAKAHAAEAETINR